MTHCTPCRAAVPVSIERLEHAESDWVLVACEAGHHCWLRTGALGEAEQTALQGLRAGPALAAAELLLLGRNSTNQS